MQTVIRFPVRAGTVSSTQRTNHICSTQPLSQGIPKCFLQKLKRLDREADHTHPLESTEHVVSWLRRLVVSLSPRKFEFAPASVQVGFLAYKVALGQALLRVLQFPLSTSVHSVSPYSYITWGWTICPLVAAVQRRSLTPSTWITITVVEYMKPCLQSL
jgi:hypothetical protein